MAEAARILLNIHKIQRSLKHKRRKYFLNTATRFGSIFMALAEVALAEAEISPDSSRFQNLMLFCQIIPKKEETARNKFPSLGVRFCYTLRSTSSGVN